MSSKSFRVLIISAFLACQVFLFSTSPDGARSYGYKDFIQYWSANQCYSLESDPYSASCMQKVQADLGFKSERPIMMWTPPLSLALLSPFTKLSYKTAGKAFFAFNILLALLSAFLAGKLISKSNTLVFGALFFYPIWSCIEHGQIAIIFLFSLLLMLYADNTKKTWLLALSIIPLSLKPHLFIFPMLYFLWRGLRERQYSAFFYIALLIAIFWGLTELFFPGSFNAWISAISRTPNAEAAVSIYEWIPATIPGLLKSWAARAKLPIANSTMLLVSGGAAGLYLWSLIRAGKVKPLNEAFSVLLIFSYLLAPYGWIFDQSILLISWLSVLAMLPIRMAVTFIVVLNVGTYILVKKGIFSSHEQLVVFAIVVALLYVLSTTLWKNRAKLM